MRGWREARDRMRDLRAGISTHDGSLLSPAGTEAYDDPVTAM
jgi:hypothetical protein